MERELVWLGGTRPWVHVVAGVGVENTEFDYAVARLMSALRQADSGRLILDVVNREVAPAGVEVHDLGSTPDAWFLEIARPH